MLYALSYIMTSYHVMLCHISCYDMCQVRMPCQVKYNIICPVMLYMSCDVICHVMSYVTSNIMTYNISYLMACDVMLCHFMSYFMSNISCSLT